MPVSDDTLALDVISDIGPAGGTFLGHPHTYKNFRDIWEPSLFPRMRYEDWVEDGRKSSDDRVNERMWEIIETHEPRPIPDAAVPRIAEIIQRARKRVPTPVAG
jgi:trimethylamine--corrinoid protein Co-methyltransferase